MILSWNIPRFHSNQFGGGGGGGGGGGSLSQYVLVVTFAKCQDFFFLCSKAFSRIIFSVILKASNRQLLDKKN